MPTGSTWTDWLGGQSTPCRWVTVDSRAALVSVLRNTPSLANRRFHVASSGHSTSAVARPVADEHAIWLDREHWKPEPQGADWWKIEVFPDGTRPYHVPACRTVKEVNDELESRSLGLLNLGSYDGQGIYGAIATGTHGSGMASGPLSDFVLSIELTTVVKSAGSPRVKSFRIEPTNGITRRDRFEDDVVDVELIQDDATFFSSVVSLGCLGVVTGLIVRVAPRFWLKERREIHPWPSFRDAVKAGTRVNPADLNYSDLVLTALPVKRPGQSAQHQVLVTTREVVKPPGTPPSWVGPNRDDARTKSARAKYQSHGHDRKEAARALSQMGSAAPKFGNRCTFQRLEDEAKEAQGPHPFQSNSFRVFRSSVGDWLAATSCEVGIPKQHWLAATDALIAELRQLDTEGLHPLSPIGIRFQQPSPHLFTQQHGRATATFEIPVPLGTFRKHSSPDHSEAAVAEILERLEAILVAAPFGGRPHFGQRSALGVHALEAAHGAASFAAFRANRAFLDPYGIFGNDFSQRLGL